MKKTIEDKILEMIGIQPSRAEMGRCPSCEAILTFREENDIECPKCGMIVDLGEAKEKLNQLSNEIKI